MAKKTKAAKVVFNGAELDLAFHRYGNGRTAIELTDEEGMPYVVATVNLVEHELAEGCVFIKDYSENEGMLDALEKAGVVKATGNIMATGWVQCPEAKLLEPYLTMSRRVK